jgi:hypothetical protein
LPLGILLHLFSSGLFNLRYEREIDPGGDDDAVERLDPEDRAGAEKKYPLDTAPEYNLGPYSKAVIYIYIYIYFNFSNRALSLNFSNHF